MSPMEALARHLRTYPELPRPFIPNSPEALKWQKKFQAWVDKKDDLEIDVRVKPVDAGGIFPSFGTFATLPKAKAPVRPAWAGATKEYNATKSRESYERRKHICRDCDQPKMPKKSRCIDCQAKADRETQHRKNEAKNARRALIRQTQMERIAS